ncbi:MAG: hypothetical protein JW384_04116 [Nitrosomonadaceae bacterium]|nr:hypothetical protein [Nitrosomonadaceae bacterium]
MLKTSVDKEINARSIFNGKRFSLGCNVPPGTNLPDFMRVLEALTRLVKDNKRGFHSIVSDVRHAFHQLPLDREISFFFAIARLIEGSEQHWRWCTLPMGWSWSPLICQCIGFGLLLILLEECGANITEYKSMRIPPPIVLVHDASGNLILVVVLWYDNIGIFTCDGSIANKLSASLKNLFEKGFHYYLKDFTHLGPNSLNKSSKQHPEYLGVRFRQSAKRGFNGEYLCQLEWQPTAKKRERWREINVATSSTCRKVARGIGVIMWVCRLGYKPLCRLDRELTLLRKASAQSNIGGSWDATLRLSG